MTLYENKDKYFDSFNKSSIPLLLLELNGKIYDFNESFEQLLPQKIKKKDLIGKLIPQALPITKSNKKFIKIILKRYNRLLNGEILEPIEILFQKSDGSDVWLNLNTSIIKIGDDKYIQAIIYDITLKRNIIEALYQSEARFRSLVENMNDGLGALDKNGMIVYVNSKTCDMLGYTSEELTRFHFLDIIDENFRELAKNEFSNRQKGISAKYELILNKKNGEKVNVILSPVPLINEKGGFDGSFAIISDITHQVEKEKIFKENYEKLEILSQIIIAGNQANNIHDLLNKILNLCLNFLNFEGGCIHLLGKNPDNYKTFIQEGIPIDILNEIKDYQYDDDYFKPLFSKKTPIFIENETLEAPILFKELGISSIASVPIIKKDSIIGILSLISKNRYKFSKFESDLFLAMGQEIGTAVDRMLFEEKLRESEEKYRSLFDSSPNAVLIMNMNGVIIDCNSISEQFSGFQKNELIGKFFLDVTGVPKKYVPEVIEDFKKLIKGKIAEREIQLYNKEGSLIWVHYSGSLVNLGDENLLQIIIQVIEDKKKAEEELKRSEEKYRFITENIDDNVAVFDEKLRLLFANESQEKISGFTVDEIINKNPLDYIHPDDKDKAIQVLKDMAKKKESSGIYRMKHKEGNYLWMDVRGKIFYDSDGELRYLLVSRDITERILAEEELKRSEEKYRFITENITDNITILDEKLRLMYTNELKFSLYGYTLDEFEGKSIYEFIYPDDKKKVKLSLKELLEKGETSKIFRIKNKLGKLMWMDVRAKNYVDPEGKRGYILVSRDITERILAEEKLRESEEKFRNLAEQSIAAIIIMQDNKYKYINQRLSDLTGYSVEEMLNWEAGEYIKKTIHPDFIRMIQEKAKERELGLNMDINNYQFKGIKKSGDVAWCELYSKPIIYEGRPANFITIMDITQQKESELKYRVISENANDLIIIINKHLQIEYINEKAFKKTLGYNKEDLIGDLDLSLIHPEDIDQSLKKITLALQTGSATTQVRFIAKNGEYIWLDVIGNSFYDKIGDTKLILIARDISWYKKVEEQLKEINRLKTDLLRRTSHELKTPLIAIKGNADLLLKLHKDKLDPKIISIVKDMKQGCIRLENIILDILKGSQLESGKLKLNKKYDNLSFLIKFTVNEILDIAAKRDQTILVDIEDDIMTNFEKETIHEVISNLLMNAIKNTPPEGVIHVKTQLNDHEVIISVEDNGIGITPAEKERLFTQFGKIERFGQGMNLGIEGTGLGLYISKKLVELHGGKIWAESEGRNKGAIFYFTLPIEEKKENSEDY
ncbi:MAG: PAS domain S-box protein [Promethearchaeota archaeon]